jgi:hypothetical protein
MNELLDAADTENLKELICYKTDFGPLSFKTVTRIVMRASSSLAELRLSNLRLSPILLN